MKSNSDDVFVPQVCGVFEVKRSKDDMRMDVGKNIRRERLLRGISIERLAELLDLTPVFVGLIEHGQRGATAYNLYKLSQIFQTNVERFYMVTDEQEQKTAVGEELDNDRAELIDLLDGLSKDELNFLLRTAKELYVMRFSDADTEDRGKKRRAGKKAGEEGKK